MNSDERRLVSEADYWKGDCTICGLPRLECQQVLDEGEEA